MVPLFESAKAASKNAYCPHSNFKVGSALKSNSSQTYCGCNVENASYSVTTCAEEGAIAAMIAAGDQLIDEITIVAFDDNDTQLPCSPCGACRQRIAEFSTKDTIINFMNKNGKMIKKSIEQLLPEIFSI